MSDPLALVAAATLIGWLAYAVDAARGLGGVSFLRDAAVDLPAPPRVSVIVAARDEADTLPPAFESLLALRYPDLQIVAVDDRSADATGEFLDRVAADPRVTVRHVHELPEGWLGKNHALHLGAAAADGEWLLFTDADVVFQPDVLLRAMNTIREHRLDHLTSTAEIQVRGPGLALFVSAFALYFNAWFRPWKASDPRSSAFVGLGAFNLVRRSSYLAMGGHAAMPLDVLDDMGLGRRLKRSGARQRLAVAGDGLRVEWYPSLGAALRGVEKNAFAAVGYSLPAFFTGLLAQLVSSVWPFAALGLTTGITWQLNAAIVTLLTILQLGTARHAGLGLWTAFALPIGVGLNAYAFARSVSLAVWRGGVSWRGTFYSLETLRLAHVDSRNTR